MIELTTLTVVALCVLSIIFSIIIIAILSSESPFGAPFFFFIPIILIPLLFRAVNFQQLFQYTFYYLSGALIWFFIKWYLRVKEIAGILKEKKWDGTYDHHFYQYVYTDNDGNIHLKQPPFSYMLSHALVFPFSIIEELFDNFLRKLYNFFKNKMQAIADSFLPKVP